MTTDELRAIETEAREQGESDARAECLARGDCLECNGEGRTPNGSGTGDTAGGWADTCDACKGTGKDLRGCEWCLITHAVRDCPAIRAELMKEAK